MERPTYESLDKRVLMALGALAVAAIVAGTLGAHKSYLACYESFQPRLGEYVQACNAGEASACMKYAQILHYDLP